MSEFLAAIVTHNFWLGVGVGVTAVYAVSVTLCVWLVGSDQ